ncbi:hypothetical protein UY3_15660 [Chelonia mydas]|uniref:Uncharacterized protein n=1 Tax=Chelonia mydas TaxID=8469 RepID=M7ARJ0_CHEMY|nr:hypothetical protein UY3_15660 [Chelonia mydas]
MDMFELPDLADAEELLGLQYLTNEMYTDILWWLKETFTTDSEPQESVCGPPLVGVGMRRRLASVAVLQNTL